MADNTLKITALTPEQLAKVLSEASRRKVSVQQVLAIAEDAGLVKSDGTINLVEYTAYLAREVVRGSD
jgi:hypothetical protein